MYRTSIYAALILAPLLGACGDDESAGNANLVTESRPATPDECANGGAVITTGTDDDGDGQISDTEVIASETVCAPDDGDQGDEGDDGVDALIRLAEESAGANCEFGGQRVEAGLDANDNGQLDAGEVESTTYVCDAAPGSDGVDYLVRTSTAVVAECDDGPAVVIESGFDDDGDGLLGDEEVETTEAVCFGPDGIDHLIDIDPEPPGANCPVGGQRIRRGFDRNGSGALEPTEVDDVQFLCDPVATLVRTSSIGAGDDCAAGGVRIESGLDVNGDGQLEEVEINATRLACAGADGTSILVQTSTLAPGADCPNGGLQIVSGLDDDGDGELAMTEIDTTTFACDGDPGQDGRGNSAARISAEPAGSNCTLGGTRIETGPDTDGDGQLDDDEVTQTRYACDGADFATLVTVESEPIGETCLAGGQRIREGVDDNGNGMLDSTEVDSTTFVCSPLNTLPITILTASVPSAFRGAAYETELEARGGFGTYEWQVISGALPDGFRLDATGNPSEISGTATATGTFVFEVAVTDFVGSVAVQTFSMQVDPPPCEPGVGGLVSDGPTSISIPSDLGGSAHGIAVDTSTTGWVYILETTGLFRFTKDGMMSEDLEALPALASLEFGYDIEFSGDDLYVLDDSSSSTSNRVQRISTDGGQTFLYTDMVSFPTNPDDLRGIAVDGTTVYVITQSTSNTELLSADISGALPATAVLEATLSSLSGCAGLDYDDDYFYTGCTGPDRVVRIDRTTLTPEDLTTSIDASTTYNAPVVQDDDGDGKADVLWFGGFDEMVYICSPGDTLPVFTGEFGAGEDADYGAARDAVNNVLWRYDESPETLFRYE